MGDFNKRCYEAIKRIPAGKVASYGQIARLVGAPRAARYVGFALHGNPEPGVIPCQRVVFADGRICEGYAFGGPDVQRAMLQEEGVAFLDDMHVDMETCRWDPEANGCALVDQGDLPGRPADIDWSREMGE